MIESVSGRVLSFFKDEHVPGWQSMIRIEFSEDDIEQLRRERFEHPHPRVQRKMDALLLKSEGLPHYSDDANLGRLGEYASPILARIPRRGHRAAQRNSLLPSTK